MSEPKFFQTRMGQRFYEHTVPELVRQIAKLNELLERLVAAGSSAHDIVNAPEHNSTNDSHDQNE